MDDFQWTPCYGFGVRPTMGTEIQIGPTPTSSPRKFPLAVICRPLARESGPVRTGRVWPDAPLAPGHTCSKTYGGRGWFASEPRFFQKFFRLLRA